MRLCAPDWIVSDRFLNILLHECYYLLHFFQSTTLLNLNEISSTPCVVITATYFSRSDIMPDPQARHHHHQQHHSLPAILAPSLNSPKSTKSPPTKKNIDSFNSPQPHMTPPHLLLPLNRHSRNHRTQPHNNDTRIRYRTSSHPFTTKYHPTHPPEPKTQWGRRIRSKSGQRVHTTNRVGRVS